MLEPLLALRLPSTEGLLVCCSLVSGCETAPRAVERAGIAAPPVVEAPAAPLPVGATEERVVPKIRTRLSAEGLLVALARGHERAFGFPAPDTRLAGAFGLCAFENAHGDALYNFNFGNIVWAGGSGRHIRPSTTSKAAMAAYETADEGAASFWRVLATRHGGALRAFDAADYPKAVVELARFGYFEADANRYDRALPRLANAALRSTIPALRLAAKKNLGSLTDSLPEAMFVSAESTPYDRALP